MNPSRALLEHAANAANLWQAWQKVRRSRGAVGVDGVSVAAYAVDVDARLVRLADALQSHAYRAAPLRRFLVPKASGGFRPLAIPTVEDRIAQTAVANIIGQRVGARFSNASYAYRKAKGPKRAGDHLASILVSETWVIIADIDRFFDTVQHDIVADLLADAGIDAKTVALVRNWIQAPVLDRGVRLQPVGGRRKALRSRPYWRISISPRSTCASNSTAGGTCATLMISSSWSARVRRPRPVLPLSANG